MSTEEQCEHAWKRVEPDPVLVIGYVLAEERCERCGSARFVRLAPNASVASFTIDYSESLGSPPVVFQMPSSLSFEGDIVWFAEGSAFARSLASMGQAKQGPGKDEVAEALRAIERDSFGGDDG